MIELLSTFSLETILIILIVGGAGVIKLIGWAKATWKKRQEFQMEAVQRGRAQEHEEDVQEHRLKTLETQLSVCQDKAKELEAQQINQQRLLELLICSDELSIKSEIKAQHDYWVPKGCIDSQILDILEQKYAIYEEEGGNSWAKKMMDDMRALPTIIVPKD